MNSVTKLSSPGRPRPPLSARAALCLQRWVGRLCFPLFSASLVAALRLRARYRMHELSSVRRRFRELVREAGDAPLVVCANHLTMIDSVLLMWAFASPPHYLVHFRRLAWNIPAVENFASSPVRRLISYLGKCMPIDRSGSREHIEGLMDKVTYLLGQGEFFMIFPEGTRSRTGRVELDELTYGVGSILQDVPHAKVLCVYMRGDNQESYSDLPARGERFRLTMELLHPHTTAAGLRGQRDLAMQIGRKIKAMEDEYFANVGEARPELAEAVSS